MPLLVKLTNLVPDSGIWLNTQRPEWNDANNALAGWGLSLVTLEPSLDTSAPGDVVVEGDGAIESATGGRLLEPVTDILGEAPVGR